MHDVCGGGGALGVEALLRCSVVEVGAIHSAACKRMLAAQDAGADKIGRGVPGGGAVSLGDDVRVDALES